jgi:2-polyprenyl-6-methoxyphenol hydroxylase-like FAD-dependent oxidoreductase
VSDVPVLVVGAGPVGLVTALELAARGIRTLVVERCVETTRHPKMDVTNCRSMEHFRRLGIAERIRDAAVPRAHCMDVAWVSGMSEWELARFQYPDVHQWRQNISAQNDGSQPLEPNMRMSQVVLEPVLRDLLSTSPLVEARYGWALESLVQDATGVSAEIRELDTGRRETVRSALLAGCDGGWSQVRQSLGIECEGRWNILPFYMVHFRTPSGRALQPHGIAWHYQWPLGGTLIAQDDEEIFTLHVVLPPGADPGSVDPQKLLYESLGFEIPCEILQANPWSPHLVVADRYGEGRVWMAGDSVHQYIPTGGYGMNTGVCDAVDLAWKFAAVLRGWGGPRLLASIEVERRPIALVNRDIAGRHMDVRLKILERYSAAIHQDTAEGASARAAYGDFIRDLGNAENESLGIELGYRYRNSPILCAEPDEPEWQLLNYVPSTWPGSRAPHVFLESGDALFDRFGPDFTLLRFADIDTSGLSNAAQARGMPMTVLDIRDANARRIYERDLVLVRPDQHVGWRADALPEDPFFVIDRLRGA